MFKASRFTPEPTGLQKMRASIQRLEEAQLDIAGKTMSEPTLEDRHAAWRVAIAHAAKTASANIKAIRRSRK